jgi:hypothetical protein
MLVLAAPAMAAPVYDGLYVLDGNGNVHTVDAAPVISPGINWGWDIARDIALTGNETGVVDGMYLLTGYGDVFAFGNAPEYVGVERPYWGWDIGRDIEPAPDWTAQTNDIAGFYVLDGFGGVFPVGDLSLPYFKVYGARVWDISTSMEVDGYVYWGWDIAEDLEISVIYDESGSVLRLNGYYVLDAYGGVHWCLEDELGDPISTPWGFTQPYWGWDIARGIEMTPTFKGYYLLDGYGAVHAVGDASFAFLGLGPGIRGTAQLFPGTDIAKDLEIVYDETGYTSEGMVILDGMGGLTAMGNVTVGPAPYTPGTDIFKDTELSPFFTFVTDAVVTGP